MARRTVLISRSALCSLPQRKSDLLRHDTLSEEGLQKIEPGGVIATSLASRGKPPEITAQCGKSVGTRSSEDLRRSGRIHAGEKPPSGRARGFWEVETASDGGVEDDVVEPSGRPCDRIGQEAEDAVLDKLESAFEALQPPGQWGRSRIGRISHWLQSKGGLGAVAQLAGPVILRVTRLAIRKPWAVR